MMNSAKTFSIALLTLFLTAGLGWAAAPIAGAWDITSTDPDENPVRALLTVKDEGGKFTGTVTVMDLVLPLADAAANGNAFVCKVSAEERVFEIKVTVAGDALQGSWTSAGGRKGAIKGTRKKS